MRDILITSLREIGYFDSIPYEKFFVNFVLVVCKKKKVLLITYYRKILCEPDFRNFVRNWSFWEIDFAENYL